MEKTLYGSWELRRPSTHEQPALTLARTTQAWQNPSLIKRTIIGFHSGESDDLQYFHLGLGEIFKNQSPTQDDIQWAFPNYQNSFLLGTRETDFLASLKNAEVGTSVDLPSSRVLTGASMGGFVALSLALRYPQLFSRVILHAPALLAFNPFDEAMFSAYSQKHGHSLEFAAYLKTFFQSAFGQPSTWTQYNPFSLLATASNKDLALLHWTLVVGSDDQLGLVDGCQAWCQAWNQKTGQNRSIEVVPGGKHDPEFLVGQLQCLQKLIV